MATVIYSIVPIVALFLRCFCVVSGGDVGSGRVCGADETWGVTRPRWLIFTPIHIAGLLYHGAMYICA